MIGQGNPSKGRRNVQHQSPVSLCFFFFFEFNSCSFWPFCTHPQCSFFQLFLEQKKPTFFFFFNLIVLSLCICDARFLVRSCSNRGGEAWVGLWLSSLNGRMRHGLSLSWECLWSKYVYLAYMLCSSSSSSSAFFPFDDGAGGAGDIGGTAQSLNFVIQSFFFFFSLTLFMMMMILFTMKVLSNETNLLLWFCICGALLHLEENYIIPWGTKER